MRKPLRLTFHRVSLGLTLAVLMVATGPARADETRPPKSRALDLFEQSARAYREGRFQDAIDLLLEARRVKPEAVLLYNLGRAYEALGKQTEAANAYAGYLAEDPRAADRRAIEGRIATLRAQADQLDRAKNPPAPPPEERRPPPEQTAAPPEEPSVAPWVLTGVGIAGIGAGVAFVLIGNARHDDAVREPRQAEAEKQQNAAQSFATGATIAFIAGAAITGVGLSWLTVRALTPSSRVALLPGPGAINLIGTF